MLSDSKVSRWASRVAFDFAGCWLWSGRTTRLPNGERGYGLLTTKSNGNVKHEYAHRLSWQIFRGDIPKELCVLHKCDVPNCVNPFHLFVGTKSDNSKDMATKGRWKNQYKDSPPTHCKRGHEFTPSNTRIGSHGERVCRACAALWAREHRRH